MKNIDTYVFIALTTSGLLLLLPTFASDSNTSNVFRATGIVEYPQPILGCGWENQSPPKYNDPTDNGIWSDTSATSPSTVSVVTTTSRSGSYSLDLHGAGGGDEWAAVYKNLVTPQPVLYMSAYFKFAGALPQNNEYCIILNALNANSMNGIARVAVYNSSGMMELTLGDYHGTTFTSSSTDYNFLLDRWYNVELYCLVDSTAGSCVVYVDGIPQISDTGIDTAAFGNIGTVYVYMMGNMNDAHDIYVDNVVISTSQTIISSAGASASVSTPINKAVYIYGRSSLTDAQTTYVANHFTLLDTDFYLGASTLQSLKTKNPSLKIIGYRELIAMETSDDDWTVVNTHEDWFAHDMKGNRIMNTQYGWLLMNISNTGWQQHYVSYVNSKLKNSQFDGVFADDCWNNLRTYAIDTSISNIPLDFQNNWHQNIVGFLQYIKANLVQGKLLIVNTDEWQTHDYLDIADGKMDEGFAHASTVGAGGYGLMPDALTCMARDSATGKIYWCASGTTETDPKNVTDTVKYCYATFLLAINGSQTYLSFDNLQNPNNSQGYYSTMDTHLGTAVGAYYYSQAVFMRDFTLGKVLLNPSSNTYTISLMGDYKLVNGTLVSGSITMTPWSGEILFS